MRKHFLTGLLIFVPLGLTIFLVNWLDSRIMGLLETLPNYVNPHYYLPFKVPGLGIIISLMLIYMVGFLGSVYLGKQIVQLYERVLDSIPGVRWLYVVAKQIMQAVFKMFEEFQARGNDRFRGVVLVEYPRIGIYSLGFVTGDTRGEVQGRTDSKVVNVFIPTTPNPTSGFYLMIPQEQLIPMDLTVDQAFRLIISAGMVGYEKEESGRKKGKAGRDGEGKGRAVAIEVPSASDAPVDPGGQSK